jgi:class 3 adenylate cyclase
VATEHISCPGCGADNRSDRRFCRSCGLALAPTCPACGATADPGDRFCGECGATLAPTATRPAAATSGADRAGGEPSLLERRLVSVLFADVVGSTALAEGADMEAVREMLGRYYDLCREVVERYAGTIEKFIGDAVMAVWGTPQAHEDDSARAVRAALDLVDAARAIRIPSGDSLVLRAGVLTGEAAASLGATGQALVAGDLVNTAARLQSIAEPGTVLVGEQTMRTTGDAILYEPAGEHVVKGRTAPVTAWRAVRVGAGRMTQAHAAGLEAPFVGRDDELRLVKEVFLQTAREHRPRLISVTGVAGIGKSRLAWELEKYCEGLVETVYWHEGRSPAYGDGLAFWALGEMVRQRARIAESDDAATARQRLAEMAADYLPDEEERARVEPRLAALLGLEAAPPGSAEELAGAWRTLFERIADRGTTVLVFEDLHWADAGLLDFIEALLGGSRARAILVIVLARPELIDNRPTWGATVRNHLRLDLAPLDADAMEMLLVGLAPGIPQDAIARIGRRAAGIPLYAVETVRMLLDSGRLVENDGRYRLSGELGDLAVPDSLTALLGARLDALEPDVRDLVGHAAVLGVSFDASALAAVSGRTEAEVRANLERLVRRELFVLDEDPRSPERGQYKFLQGVLREVAYGRLSRRERQLRHLGAAELLGASAADELAGVVATHYLEAVRLAADEDREALRSRALAALEGAATRAQAIGAHASAARLLKDAVGLAADEDERLRLREMRVMELSATESGPEVLAETELLLESGRERGDLGLQARAAFWACGPLLAAGHPADAVRRLTEMRDSLGTFVTEHPDGVQLLAELGRCHLMAGDGPGALPIIDEALVVAQRLGLKDTVGELLASKGWALGVAGRPVEAAVLLRGAVWFAEREGLLRAEFRSRMNLSAWTQRDDSRETLEITRRGLERAQRLGLDAWVFPLAGNAMDAALQLGDWDWIEATAAELRVEEQGVVWRSVPMQTLELIAAMRGDDARSASLHDRFARFTEGHEDPQLAASTLSTRIFVSYARGDLEGATRPLGELLGHRDLMRGEDGLTQTLVGVARRDPGLLTWRPMSAGRADAAGEDIAAAVRDVLGGNHARLELVDEGIDVLDATGHHLFAALFRTERALLAPDDPGAGPSAQAAAAWFRRLGAVAMLSRLEPFLEPDGEQPARDRTEAAATV